MTHSEKFNKLYNKFGITYKPAYPIEEIGSLIDDVVMCMGSCNFDINELDYDSPEQLDYETKEYIFSRYGEVIKNVPLELIYYFGIVDTITDRCFLYNRAFGLDKDEIVNKYFEDIEALPGRFTNKIEDIMINKLGIKSLVKN
jgi:hypothetical protein